MNNDVLEKMNALVAKFEGIQISDFVISSGCALFLLGLRDKFDDIDVSVNTEVFQKLVDQGCVPIDDKTYRVQIIRIEDLNIDIHRDNITFNKPTLTMQGGVKILTPKQLLKEKDSLFKRLGRDKDLVDINNLRRFIGE